TGEGQMRNVSILGNGLMNNTAKDFWMDLSRLREKSGDNFGKITLKMPAGVMKVPKTELAGGERVVKELSIESGDYQSFVLSPDGSKRPYQDRDRLAIRYKPLPGGEWSRANLENQIVYLIPWTLNVISLLTLASTDMFKIPGTEITIPIIQL